MNPRAQKLCVAGGPLSVTVFFLGLFIAGFIPPPSPSLSPEEVAALYQDNTMTIRIGLSIVMVGAAFYAPFAAAIAIQVRRIEVEGHHVFSYTQLAAGLGNAVLLLLPSLLWLVTAYRPDRPVEQTYLLNDLSWIVGILPWSFAAIQCLAVACAILMNPGKRVFPRWVAFLSIWAAVGFVPGSVLPFVYSGPFTWGGLFPFWVGGAMFGIWTWTMWYQVGKAANKHAQE